MGKTKAQKRADALSALLKELEEKYNSLPVEATDEEKAELQNKIELTKAELEEINLDLNKSKLVKVKFLKSPTGAPFYLGYYEGDEVELDTKQAAELIAVDFAKEVID